MTFLRNAFIKFYPRMFSLSDISALGQFYIIRQNLGIHFFLDEEELHLGRNVFVKTVFMKEGTYAILD